MWTKGENWSQESHIFFFVQEMNLFDVSQQARLAFEEALETINSEQTQPSGIKIS